MRALVDTHRRKIDYLRISITDRCNLNCSYCKTEDFKLLERDEILTLEESARIVKVASSLGVSKVRITGGEPLIRRNIIHFIRMVRDIPGIDEISLTTNGTLLAGFADELVDAGIKRINISLDTLKRERFKKITSKDKLGEVLEGIEKALDAGFSPVKLNVVVMKGVNDDEILDFGQLTFEHPLSVRFIEHMPIQKSHTYVPVSAVMKGLSELGALIPLPACDVIGNGPAHYVKYEDAKGTIGFISPLSHSFCDRCNRLRITVDGRLFPCLMSGTSYDVKQIIRSKGSDEDIAQLILQVVREKAPGPVSDDESKKIGKPMASIGG
jgi:cyclic pyranopterin phosphate synthase